jgi:hypothetical protein
VVEKMAMSRNDYQGKMEEQLKQWGAWIEELQAKATKVGAETKKTLLTDLAELKRLQATGTRHVANVETFAAHTWELTKSTFTDKWNQISGAFDAVRAHVHGISTPAGKEEKLPDSLQPNRDIVGDTHGSAESHPAIGVPPSGQ